MPTSIKASIPNFKRRSTASQKTVAIAKKRKTYPSDSLP